MTPLELSRPVLLHDIGARRIHRSLTAKLEERAALAKRFGLARLDALAGEFDVKRDAAGIRVTGTVSGNAVQICVVSGDDVPTAVHETVDLVFAPLAASDAEEVELTAPDLDVLPLDSDIIDLGEVAAETLGLALDPFPRAPDAALSDARAKLIAEEDAARLASEDSVARNPFRVLKGGKDS